MSPKSVLGFLQFPTSAAVQMSTGGWTGPRCAPLPSAVGIGASAPFIDSVHITQRKTAASARARPASRWGNKAGYNERYESVELRWKPTQKHTLGKL